jgi:hypothetical protein
MKALARAQKPQATRRAMRRASPLSLLSFPKREPPPSLPPIAVKAARLFAVNTGAAAAIERVIDGTLARLTDPNGLRR